MICEKCGHESEAKPVNDPWCMYRFDGVQVVSDMFDPDKIPKGWYGSPGEAMAAIPKTKKATSQGLTV